MTRRVVLFCEDAAHESWARALLARIAREEDVQIDIQVGSASAGIPRLKRELRAFDRTLQRGSGLPDLLVVLIDANTSGIAARRTEIEDSIDLSEYPYIAIGTPDPHVECWYLAEPDGFAQRFGIRPDQPDATCKEFLVDALERAGEIVLAGGSEFADEIVDSMDLYRAGQRQTTLKRFIDDLRAALRSLRQADAPPE
jgi:hypothetical protein